MTIAALRLLLDQEQPGTPRHPAPEIPHITAEKRKLFMQQSPVPGPRTPQQPAAGGTTSVPVGKLLAWAEAHETRFVSRKGEQARALLRELRGLYAEAEELAQADAEEQRLVQQLEAIRARKDQLRPRRKTSAPGYDQAVVRAWARANGHTVPDRGSLPGTVVEAWRRAQQQGGDQ